MADDGNGRGRRDLRKCSHISWKKEKQPSSVAVFYGPGFRFKMPSQCPQLTHTERAEMVTQTAPLFHPPAPSPPPHTMANTDICESRVARPHQEVLADLEYL